MEKKCNQVVIPRVDNEIPFCPDMISEDCVMINSRYPFVKNQKEILLSEFLKLLVGKNAQMSAQLVELRKELDILKGIINNPTV